MGSETLPSACYILSEEPSIPFYSTSNGYNKGRTDLCISYRKKRSFVGLTETPWFEKCVCGLTNNLSMPGLLREDVNAAKRRISSIFFCKLVLAIVRMQNSQFPKLIELSQVHTIITIT